MYNIQNDIHSVRFVLTDIRSLTIVQPAYTCASNVVHVNQRWHKF